MIPTEPSLGHGNVSFATGGLHEHQLYRGGVPLPFRLELVGAALSECEFLAVLLGLGDDSSNGLMWTHAILRDRLPEKVIPFAEDPGGSVFCFDFRSGSDHPPVVYWPHDVRPIVLIPVADNFELMLEKLHLPID